MRQGACKRWDGDVAGGSRAVRIGWRAHQQRAIFQLQPIVLKANVGINIVGIGVRLKILQVEGGVGVGEGCVGIALNAFPLGFSYRGSEERGIDHHELRAKKPIAHANGWSNVPAPVDKALGIVSGQCVQVAETQRQVGSKGSGFRLFSWIEGPEHSSNAPKIWLCSNLVSLLLRRVRWQIQD